MDNNATLQQRETLLASLRPFKTHYHNAWGERAGKKKRKDEALITGIVSVGVTELFSTTYRPEHVLCVNVYFH